ncbi:cyclic nucleotide-binding domain-containing protein [Brevundimonas diminuta]|uniref:cyclic nucleotide-binding domain-containing protein n=1 Tax=Brevundimonas diminuta TaxID=293 RepID=UPI0012F843AA
MTARLDNARETISASFFPIRGRPQTLGVVHPYACGDQIYAEGDPAHSFYTVISGAVRTVRHSPDGRRQIGDFYYAGDLFGFEADEERPRPCAPLESGRSAWKPLRLGRSSRPPAKN